MLSPSAAGKTLFDYMEEAQRCHQLAFISAGKIVVEGTPEIIKQNLGVVKTYRTELAYEPDIAKKLLALEDVLLLNLFGTELRLLVSPKL